MKVSVVKETAPGERRVALVPEAVVKLRAAGLEVLVESGAGDGAWHTDDSYAEAGASVVSRSEALAADVVLMVGKPDAAALAALRPGQLVIGLLAPLTDPDLTAALAAAGVTAVSMDMIPRTLPRAQPMDALSSQANIAGYKAALLGARPNMAGSSRCSSPRPERPGPPACWYSARAWRACRRSVRPGGWVRWSALMTCGLRPGPRPSRSVQRSSSSRSVGAAHPARAATLAR